MPDEGEGWPGVWRVSTWSYVQDAEDVIGHWGSNVPLFSFMLSGTEGEYGYTGCSVRYLTNHMHVTMATDLSPGSQMRQAQAPSLGGVRD